MTAGIYVNIDQVMACYLMAPSHYLNQCWLIITEVQWRSSEGKFAWEIIAISLKLFFYDFIEISQGAMSQDVVQAEKNRLLYHLLKGHMDLQTTMEW